MTVFNEALLRRMWPHGDAKIPGLIAGIAASAPAVFQKYGVNSDLVIAQAMAQFSHECGAGLEMTENLNYSAQGLMKTWPSRFDSAKAAAFAHQPQKIANEAYNGRMANRTGTDDGWNFRGRGLPQTTGRAGYQNLSGRTGLDLINNPDFVSAPDHALECGVADFILCGCLPFAVKDDVLNVTKRLNGGTIGYAERQAWLVRWKAALAAAPVGSPEARDTHWVQISLNALGCTPALGVDGDYGTKSRNAVTAFKIAMKLPADDVLDHDTIEALATAVSTAQKG